MRKTIGSFFDYHYQDNFEGKVEIREKGGKVVVTVPFGDLRRVVADWVRYKERQALERASVNDVLFREW